MTTATVSNSADNSDYNNTDPTKGDMDESSQRAPDTNRECLLSTQPDLQTFQSIEAKDDNVPKYHIVCKTAMKASPQELQD